MKRFALKFSAIAIVVSAAAGANGAVEFDKNVTNAVITGGGIANGGFTRDTDSGIEIGLRARQRYGNPTSLGVYSPTNNVNSNGDGTYSHATGGFTSGPGGTGTMPGPRAGWNFDWSINTGTANINAYTYRIGIDYNAGFGTNYQVFDLINGGNPGLGGLAAWDHSFGSGATTQGNGAEASGANAVAYLASYNGLKLSNSLVQNSWNLAFFTTSTYTFDPTANGNYSVYLEALDGNGRSLARSDIDVIVGTGAVPEPGSLALAGLALAGLFGVSRRKAR